ncbi:MULTISPECIES: hypothetical protein [Acinetobacter]|uniref:Uncharacterized protein n=2 Tax=Acinetobacter TaxID=469 RepID=A0A7H2VD68_9GAMM|nr:MULTISPECIES: hypothetical protein [Acinetobacter]OEY93236.1 hypothetical protein BJD20_20315 [Acinetobacter proteolyticus]EKU2475724.1 hypothetical protein [Acinetobacter baumannii]EXB08785.1 hypothetical protein J514_3653 [Acinetobacter sp. 1396970]KQD10153.1 hypothetical protein APD05_07770 [Acinetobacter nosocomialis]KQE38015.1 hypothetical protein APD42_14555 [Acinetobacter nosocomialis]
MISIKFLNGQGERSSNLDFFYQLSEQIFVILDGYEETTEKDITQFCEQLALISYKDLESLIATIKELDPSFKSSITLLEIRANEIRYIYLGDIRIYVNSKLVTKDHSYAWKILERTNCFSSEIIASRCLTHKYRNQIYKSIQNIRTDGYEITEMKIEIPSHILVCTDGYWMLEHKQIIASDNYSLKELPSKDNYSAISISIT